MDQQSRNLHNSKLSSSDQLHSTMEDHTQELQKKARMRIVNMYQRRDLLAEELAAGAADADE